MINKNLLFIIYNSNAGTGSDSQAPTIVTTCLAIFWTMSGRLPSLHMVVFPSTPTPALSSLLRKSPRQPFSRILFSTRVSFRQKGKSSEILPSYNIRIVRRGE